MAVAHAQPTVIQVRQRRNSAKASSPALNHATGGATRRTPDRPAALLILWDDLPPWRRDNAFILGGYRSPRPSYRHALRSLFYLHNESVNIWSHLLGALVALVASLYLWSMVQPRYESASRADELVFACFFAGAVSCLSMSATFHALVDHSEPVARWGNKLDYAGIVALIVGSYVPALYYGFFCRPPLMMAYLSLIGALGCGCAIVAWVEQFRLPRWRPYRATMFISLGLSGVVPVIHGLLIYGYRGLENRMSLKWVVISGVLYIIGAVLYALRWPERTCPGAYDIWGSSHQLFHVLVLLAAAMHLYGMANAFDYRHSMIGSQCLMEHLTH